MAHHGRSTEQTTPLRRMLCLALLALVASAVGAEPLPMDASRDAGLGIFLQDILSVGEIPLTDPGSTVEVPIYLTDVVGTLLDADSVAGFTPQNFVFTVRAEPAGAFDAITLERAGVLETPTPLLEVPQANGDMRGLILAFDETGDPAVLTPGAQNQVAKLILELKPSFTEGTVEIKFLIEGNGLGGKAGFSETVPNGELLLEDGDFRVGLPDLFDDDFETGDTAGWTTTIGGL